MTTLYQRLTKRGLDDTEAGIAIQPFFGDLLRYNRTTRLESEIKASHGLTQSQWDDALILLGKIEAAAQSGRMGTDSMSLLALLEWNRDVIENEYGIHSWEDLLAELDSWVTSGVYDASSPTMQGKDPKF